MPTAIDPELTPQGQHAMRIAHMVGDTIVVEVHRATSPDTRSTVYWVVAVDRDRGTGVTHRSFKNHLNALHYAVRLIGKDRH